MSEELEAKVLLLIEKEEKKKEADKISYAINKEYNLLYDSVMALLTAGHTLPIDSSVYAQIVEKPRDRVNSKEVLQWIKTNYRRLAKSISELEQASREKLVQKLDYGYKEK